MADAILAILLASAIAATLVDRRANKAVSQGRIADDGQRTSGEQASGSPCASMAITEPCHRQPGAC